MEVLRRRVLAALGAVLAGWAGAAQATTVRWLHIEQNPQVVAFFSEVASRFEAANPGTRIELQYLENDAYKKKLTTLLQSPARPHLIYSWGGGVLRAQVQAGVIEDLSPAVTPDWRADYSPVALNLYTVGGRLYGLPMVSTQAGFFYNRALFAKAGIDAAAIRNWDDLLAAVRALQAVGVTPMLAGGGDKWPLHFYWSHLALRIGGRAAFEAAVANKGKGFADETFVKAGERFKQLADLKPFQSGFIAASYPQAAGQFGDGKGAMMLIMDGLRNTMRANAADRQGLTESQMGWFPFPAVPGGRGAADDTLGGMNGWLVTRGAPKETVAFLKFLTSAQNQRMAAERGFYVPAVKGAEKGLASPLLQRLADNVARSPYHQLFYDQMLGPAVGAVVNDVSADLASGRLSPGEAAARVQQAWQRAQ